ncbi:MAG: PorT family protein [Flammeovirgaceae bacterium]|nr:MAG: PorT family protein [Flammeovirgaceae bacterium]
MPIRLLLSLITLITISTELYSQSVIIPRFGVTVSRTNASNLEGIEQVSKAGISLGAAVEFKLTTTVAIQPELNYTQKGFGFNAQETDQGFFINVENKTRVDYLEVPLFAKIYLGAGSKVYFLAGPSIAVGIGGQSKSKVETDLFGTPLSITVKGKVKFGDPPATYNPEEDTEVYFDNRLDFGIQGGLGISLYRQAAVEFRYNYGLSGLQDEEDSQNRVLHINIAVPLNTFVKSKE